MSDTIEVAGARLRLVKGDITEQEVDAIVNAANPSLMGGGGVDGAIHEKGGPAILEACKRLRSERYPRGLPTGDAVPIPAGRLAATAVIHTVGPVWSDGVSGEPELLKSAYRRSLEVAAEGGHRRIAFPSISTGAYGYPVELAAPLALETIRSAIQDQAGAFDEVRMVLFSDAHMAAYRRALADIL